MILTLPEPFEICETIFCMFSRCFMFRPVLPSLPLGKLCCRQWLALLLSGVILCGASKVSAFDSTDLPIRVFIDPVIKINGPLADPKAKLPLPEKAYRAFRQGVLDWIRLVATLPNEPSNVTYTLILRKQTSEESLERYERFGFIVFTTNPEDADLVIESVDNDDALGRNGLRNYYEQLPIGYHALDRKHRIGRITMALKRGKILDADELDLRVVLLHEIGHALGFDHYKGQKCNLMNATNYACIGNALPECTSENTAARCLAIEDSQLRFVEAQLMADRGKGPKMSYLDWRQYQQQVEWQVRDVITGLGEFKEGRLSLQLLTDGSIKNVVVAQTFGSPEKDEQIRSRLKQIGNFGRFPATREKTESELTLAYTSNTVSDKYLQDIKEAIIPKIGPILPVKATGKLHLKIKQDGQLLQAEITESFGNERLDRIILQRVRELKGFPPLEDDEYQERYAMLSFQEKSPLDEAK